MEKLKTKNKKCSLYKIEIPVYNDYILVYMAKDVEDAIKEVEDEYDVSFTNSDMFAALTTTLKKKGREVVILMMPTDASNKVIAHESVHLAWDILDSHYVKVDADNHEALTYLVEYIVGQIGVIQK